jgi:hypothetical protein
LWRENPWVGRYFSNAAALAPLLLTLRFAVRRWPRAAEKAFSAAARGALRAWFGLRGVRHGPPAVRLERGCLKLHTVDHAPAQGPVSDAAAAEWLRRSLSAA